MSSRRIFLAWGAALLLVLVAFIWAVSAGPWQPHRCWTDMFMSSSPLPGWTQTSPGVWCEP